MVKKFLNAILIANAILILSSINAYALPDNQSSSNTWLQEERFEKQEILKAFWSKRIIQYNKNSVDGFKSALINSHFPKDASWETKLNLLFQDAINHKINFELFLNSLEEQPLVLFYEMNDVEKIIPQKHYKQIYPNVTQADISTIQQYINNKNLSVSITLSSFNAKLITPHFKENQYQYPFAIHSIGKVFTGMLALIMIEKGILTEGDLQSPVQLDDVALRELPVAVREQLKKATLYQLMTHRSGLGDYLGKYCEAISSGHIPIIRQAEDFLPFVEDKVYPIGEERYSNAGLLIVGLALKHAYEEKFKHSINYDDILKKYIINPVGITSFTPWKPINAKYNLQDPIAPFIAGSPAGGYWITSSDLAKFGQWIYRKSSTDPVFKSLIKKYGQEFYHPESNTVAHGGGIPSSNAFFSVSLKTGAVLAIESNQPPGLPDDLKTMIQNHIYAKRVN